MATHRKTVRPRVSFVPTAQVAELLNELSELSGQSKASIASEMLDEVAPVIRGQLEALRKVAAAPEQARQHVQDYAMRAVQEIAQTVLAFDEPNKPKRVKRANRQ